MNILIIPARGGSKRIPEKNIIDFLGQPIITRVIRTAFASGLFKKVIVSTDNEKIAHVAKAAKAEVNLLIFFFLDLFFKRTFSSLSIVRIFDFI